MNNSKKPQKPGYVLIFRRFRKDPVTGELKDAWRYGIRAWPMWVKIQK